MTGRPDVTVVCHRGKHVIATRQGATVRVREHVDFPAGPRGVWTTYRLGGRPPGDPWARCPCGQTFPIRFADLTAAPAGARLVAETGSYHADPLGVSERRQAQRKLP